jgi:NADH-quinone oxidoreductase subunit I
MSALVNYFKEIFEVVQSTRKGMALTWKHAWDARKQRTVHQIQDAGYFQQSEGIVTLEYPTLQIPTPVNGRYQLHNEMDDCIVCDKCVKVCPVDCIDIEPIKATGLVGHASDGSPIRLYAAKFDIDMSKCCFCGLCTTVCPTECLTMTSEYDFSVFDVKEHNFAFANLTAEEADEKRKLYEQFVAEKAAMKEVASPEGKSMESEGPTSNVQSPTAKPVFKPSFKKASQSSVVSSQSTVVGGQDATSTESEGPTSNVQSPTAKPAFKPSFKKASPESVVSSQSSVVSSQDSSSPESVLSSQSSAVGGQDAASPESDGPTSKPKPAFKPSFKKASPESVVSSQSSAVGGQDAASPESDGPTSKPKPAFKPSFKPKANPKPDAEESNNNP